MLLSIEDIEDLLQSSFRKQVSDRGISHSARFLRRWAYLSSQVPRLHGAALSRVKIPEIQGLFAEIAHGECGGGNRQKIHSTLLAQLMALSDHPDLHRQKVDLDLEEQFEVTVSDVCRMDQDEAIGFIVGLEAPAYDILQLLKDAFVAVGIPQQTVLQSEYIVIHDVVEQEHQDSGHEAMKIIQKNGCDLRKIHQGGDRAIQFLVNIP